MMGYTYQECERDIALRISMLIGQGDGGPHGPEAYERRLRELVDDPNFEQDMDALGKHPGVAME